MFLLNEITPYSTFTPSFEVSPFSLERIFLKAHFHTNLTFKPCALSLEKSGSDFPT